MHPFLWHILLCEYFGQLLSTVITEVDEDNDVTLLDCSIYRRVVDRLDKLVCHTLCIACLNRFNHVSSLYTLAFNEQVVCFLHTVPTLVTVHCIETTNDRSNMCAICVTHLLDVSNETSTTLWVSVTSVHEAMNVNILEVVLLSNLNQLEEVVERRVNTTCRGQTHQVKLLTCLLCIAICINDTLVLQDVTCLTCFVNLYEVLINNTTCTYI